MAIDWTRPIQLTSGREAEVVELRGLGNASVKIRGAYCPEFERLYPPSGISVWAYDGNGRWVGGGNSYYRIVNADDSASFIPEDWS